MLIRSFGKFMLSKGILNEEKLIKIAQKMKSDRPLIGSVAFCLGYMTEPQVLEINNRQKSTDKRFGDLAVESGYLSEQELDTVLSVRKNELLLLEQCLVKEQILSSDDFQKLMDDYSEHILVPRENISLINAENVEKVVSMFFGNNQKISFLKLFTATVKSFIRFVDPFAAIDMMRPEFKPFKGYYVFSQPMSCNNGVRFRSNLIAGRTSFMELATKFSGSQVTRFDRMTKDIVGEFLNLSNGLFAVDQSTKDIEITMRPQFNFGMKDKDEFLKKKCVLPILMDSGIIWISVYVSETAG